MWFFSKKNTSRIADHLLETCINTHSSLNKNIKELENTNFHSDKRQSAEILIIPVLAVIIATNVALNDRQKIKMLILDEFYEKLLNKYFHNKDERDRFNELFDERYKEYKDILDNESPESSLLFGKKFCNHLFGDGNNNRIALMYMIRAMYSVDLTTTKEFLDVIKLSL